MQVCLEGQNFRIATASLPVEIQTGEMLDVPHPSCVHLHEFLYPLRLILGTITALIIVRSVRKDERRHRERTITLVCRLSEVQAAGDDAVVVGRDRNRAAFHILFNFILNVT